MKLTISNVTYGNAKAIKALIAVALNAPCTTYEYEELESNQAKTRAGYMAAYELFKAVDTQSAATPEEVADMRLAALQESANPYTKHSYEWFGWNRAVRAAKNDMLMYEPPITRLVITTKAEQVEADLLFRFANQLGKAYRNVVVITG